MSPKVSFFKKLLSYIYPVTIQRSTGVNNAPLELLLYRGQWQLGMNDALYSDGDRYRPALSGLKQINNKLPSVTKILVLGTGLASVVMIMNRRRFFPDYTLVDHDEASLEWTMQLYDADTVKRLHPVCMDARDFMKGNKELFDIVFVDIFEGRHVPDFVTSNEFLTLCRNSLTPGGNCIINYIENDPGAWNIVYEKIKLIFQNNKVENYGINRIVTATVGS